MRRALFSIIGLLLLFVGKGLYAQEQNNPVDMFHNYSQLLSPEKVYLHTDKDVYFVTDTIWISGYVENASYAAEFDESNYIYVELICDQLIRDDASISNFAKYEQKVVVRKKLRRVGETFQGHIVVPEMNSTGRAVLRGYTYWMLNRPVEYMFYKEVEITNPIKDKTVAVMKENEVKRKADYLRIGELSPFEKEKLEKKEAKKERYDVQFLPESGNALAGTNATIYIRSISSKGTGAAVSGDVLDASGNVLTQYATDSLGFGKIVIPNIPLQELSATVTDTTGYSSLVKLPAPVATGVAINGIAGISSEKEYSEKDFFRFSVITSESLLANGLMAVLHNGSEVYYTKPLQRVAERLTIQPKALSAGIHSISVVDLKGQVYAERPFVVLPCNEEAMSIDTDKEEYGRRDLVNVSIKLPEGMADSTSNFSVAVTDAGTALNLENTTMESYMLLKSELQGYVEDIAYYFNRSIPLSKRMQRGDMLMQTQGWRYYDLPKIVQGKSEVPHFGKEYQQTLFGKVVNMTGLTNRAIVSFLAPSIGFKAMGQIDSGYFVLHDVNFPEGTRFIISAVGKNGRSIRQTPELMQEYYAPVFKYPVKPEGVTYSDEYKKVVEHIYYNNDDIDHALEYELDPVVVTSQLITPKNSPSPIANYPIKREWYRDTLAMKSYAESYTVSAYVAATYSGVREVFGDVGENISVPDYAKVRTADTTADAGGVPSGSLIGPKSSAGSMAGGQVTRPGRYGLVLVYLNGSFIHPEEAVNTVLSLPLSQVESMIYVSGVSAAAFQPSFDSGDVNPYPVLMVRTKPHVKTNKVPYNVSCDYPLGWQKPVKFYAPKYNSAEARRTAARDNRITLYWNPSVKVDANGEAWISFYTTDSASDYRIEIEGKSADRQYHYVEKIVRRKQ